MFNRKLCFICFASHSMTNYIRHHVLWTTLISGWKLFFFYSFFTFGATKINTVTFSRFIYIIFYRKCQNYLCFIFLLKFDIMFFKKKSLFQFFSTWNYFLKYSCYEFLHHFLLLKICFDLNYSMYECFCLTDNDFVLFQQTSRMKGNSMYLGTTGAQKGAEVQVCYMHIFYIFKKIIVQLRLLLLSIFVYNG